MTLPLQPSNQSRTLRKLGAISTGLLRPSPLAVACSCLLAFGAMAPAAKAAVTLSVAGTAFTLAAGGTGAQNIRVEATATTSTSNATVVVGFFDYQTGAQLATGSLPLGTQTGLQVLQVPVNVPQLGFYNVTVNVVQSGSVIATASTSYAAVPVRNSVGPSDFGVCTHIGGTSNTSLQAPYLNLVKLAGFSRVRDNVYWTTIEPTAGAYTFPANYENYVNTAYSLGLKPLLILGTGNGSAYPGFDSNGLPNTTTSQTAFGNYAKQCVLHYGAKVKQWEIWNEPAAEYSTYSSMLLSAYPAIKGADSTATVISCAGGGAGGGAGGNFISGIHAAGTAFDDQDGYSTHPYMSPSDPDLGYSAPGSPLNGQRANVSSVWGWDKTYISGHPKSNGVSLSYWVTEIGWACVNTVTDSLQAAYLARTFLLSREKNIAQGVFIYDFVNDGTSTTNSELNFGLLRNDWSPKPSYSAMAVLASTLGSLPWTSALIENSSTKVEQYGSGTNFMIAAWTVAGDTQNITLSLPSGSYTLRDWQGRDTVVASVGGSLPVQINGLPQYVLPRNFETENLTVANYVSASGGTERIMPVDPSLSNADGTILDSNNIGDYVTFVVPNIAVGTYDVRVGVKKYPARGIFQLQIGRADNFSGTVSNVGTSQDEYASTAVYSELDLGNWTPGTSSDKWFRFLVSGKNAASTGDTYNTALCFDYIKLIPQ